MIRVDGGFDAIYDGYFFEGLRRRGRVALRRAQVPGRGMAVTLDGRNVFFDGEDSSDLIAEGLSWCDVYAKCNVSPSEPDPRVVALGPCFPIRFGGWSRMASLGAASVTLSLNRKATAQSWKRQLDRLPVSSYRPGRSDPSYVFFATSYWAKEPATNAYRANFFRAARNRARFEGGFNARADGSIAAEHADLVHGERVSHHDWVERTRRSAVVFMTPAVFGAITWKLGEFLALGKAIISTPLGRRLPAPLVHGEHVHYVDGSPEQIGDALDRIVGDEAYRTHLEANARRYWWAELRPDVMAGRALKASVTV